jgi:hypothetical protein
MKKFIGMVLFSIVFLFGIAAEAKEYCFMNIPWGTELTELGPKFSELGFKDLSDSEYTSLFDWNIKSKIYLSNTKVLTDVGKDIKCYTFTEGFNIAGHEVNRISASLLYDYNSKSVNTSKYNLVQVGISFKAGDPKIVYEDLLSKLTVLYGKPKSYDQNDSILNEKCSIWLGSSNTGIALVLAINGRDSNYFSIDLYYGKTNVEEMISELKKVKSKEAVSNAQGNFFGL